MIDYIVCTKGWKHLVFSCEVVRSVPCGTHIGVRTIFVPNAEDVFVTTLRTPKTLEAAVAHFRSHDLVDPDYVIPAWEVAEARTQEAARQHVIDHQVKEVDDYIRQLDIEDESLKAAIKYARWSAAAEYRLLASHGIKVGDVSIADLEPYLGRGRFPVLERVSLAMLSDTKRNIIDQMAWSLGVDDAYGHDRFTMVAAVLKQIFLWASQGRRTSLEGKSVLRNVLTDADQDNQCGNLITRIALAVAPSEGESHEEHVASKQRFAARRLANIERLLACNLTIPEIEQCAKILLGLTKILQARNPLNATNRMAESMCTSIDSGGVQVFKFLEGGRQPDTMMSALFACVATDSGQVLKEKLKE